MKHVAFIAAVLALGACAHQAPQVAPTPTGDARIIPAVDGEVYIPDKAAQGAYDRLGFAPARRAGDTVYVSGIIVGPPPGEGTDVEAFKEQARRAFRRMETILATAGLKFENVAMINSFHIWDGPNFKGTRDEQIAALNDVKNEFFPLPHPAWTAVGTTGLLSPAGVVEIQLTAHVPSTGGPRKGGRKPSTPSKTGD